MTNKTLQSIALLLGLAFSSAALAQNCKSAHQFKTVTPKVLSVVQTVIPPYSIPGKNGELGGVEGDIIQQVAARECLTIKTFTVDYAAATQYVISGKADVVIGDWYRTVERARVMGLSHPLYLDQMGIASKAGLNKAQDLIGKKVGTVQGYLWVSDMQKMLGSSLVAYPNSVAMAQDLAAGRIDIATDSYAVIVHAQSKGGYAGMKVKVVAPDKRIRASIQAGQSAFLYNKKNTAFGQALSNDIQALHKSGQIVQILKKHGLDPSAGNVGTPRLVE